MIELSKKQLAKIDGPRLTRLRERLGMNQTEFWRLLGTTQSGGSRYENHRNVPAPVRMLAALVFEEELQRSR